MKKRFAQGTFLLFFFFLLSACTLAIPGVAPDALDAPTSTATRISLFPVVSKVPTRTARATRPTSTAKPLPVTKTPSSTPAASLTPTQTATPTATLPPLVPVVYNMDVTINYSAKTLDVVQKISYQNKTGQILNSLVLAVEPNLINDVFKLNSLAINDVISDKYELSGQKLVVRLPAPLGNRETLKLTLTYHLKMPLLDPNNPNDLGSNILGYTTRQMNLVDWYPFIVPYGSGVGWVLHEPLAYGEHLVYEQANYNVIVRFADATPGLIVASSGQPEPDLGFTTYRSKNTRAFAFSISDQFKVISQKVGNVIVSSYYFSAQYAPSAQGVLDATVNAVKTYRDLFGAYPHQTLAAVQGDFTESMEFDGLFFVGVPYYDQYETNEQRQLVSVAVHETAHQWWFGRVGNDQFEEPWLDEALAMYSEEIFYEMNFPENLPWWWDKRINSYQPQGYIDLSAPEYGSLAPYTNATYRMGALFLDELRQFIGDDAFFAFLKDYATRMNGKIATTADFFRILSKNTNADVDDLTAIYFLNPP